MSSTSATNVSPVAPPNTPAANLFVLSGILSFNDFACFIPSCKALDLEFKYSPAFFFLIAFSQGRADYYMVPLIIITFGISKNLLLELNF